MPRRPRKQSRAFKEVVGAKRPPRAVKKSDANIKKWVRREDIAGNDEDDFHEARDRILLEDDDVEGSDWSDGEEEVFGLGLEDDDYLSEVDEQGEGADPSSIGSQSGPADAPRKREKSKLSLPKPKSSSSSSESEESESWGRKKSAYYASNAALLSGKEGEEDEEEANEMEEREARRLQARLRDSMKDEDYGLGDAHEIVANDMGLEADDPGGAPIITISTGVPLDEAEALHRLEKTSPETLALAREWDDVARELIRVQDRLDKLELTTPDALSLGLNHLHHQTLLTYVTTLAFFLHLRATIPSQTSPSLPSDQIKSVLERLLTLKQALITMEELDFDADMSDEDEWDSNTSDLDEEGLAELGRLIGRRGSDFRKDMDEVLGKGRGHLEEGELEELLRNANTEVGRKERTKQKTTKNKDASMSQQPLVDISHFKNETPGSKVTFDLEEPDFVPMPRSAARPNNDELEAYGEVTALSMVDNRDKKDRRRTLRFHTSKIESSARRKEEARERLGGDEDIPYRERKKEKEARTRREVEKDRGQGGEDLDPGSEVDTSTVSVKRKRGVEDYLEEQEGDDGYYELVKRSKKEQKEKKKKQYEDARLMERFGVNDTETSGPRSLTRAILKNKGLTPRRSKSVRNPRVKKRKQFEKAKKKVRSQKAVFKEGLAGKPYGGEESGITKVVKSIKL